MTTKLIGEMTDKPKVRLVGEDGNAFAIMGRAVKALKSAGYREQAKEYQERATSGDYNNLLSVTLEYVDDAWGDEEDEDYDWENVEADD